MYYTYVLQSLKDQKLYIGYSSNLKKRLNNHTSGRVSATKSRLPLRLIYYEAYLHKQDDKGREKFLKGGSGHKYLNKQLQHFFNEHH